MNEYRPILEDIALECQSRANKAQFCMITTKGAIQYQQDQYNIFNGAYNALQGMFKYIANKYNEVIDEN